ncbi:MAG: erythromycin esterase family protein [Deltaproteobacteria bacterium]|nr:erythromycin esterase family protein [Deltaproteobacteria bacterium]
MEEKGFRAYAWESPWDDALVASEYVQTCDGTSREALHSLFGVWWDPSVQDTLEWMCAWNQDHPDDPLYFFGWDIQQGADDGIRLQAFLETGAPEVASTLYAGIATCAGVGHPSMASFYGSADYLAYENGQVSANDNTASANDNTACHDGLDAIDAHIDANEAALEAATSADEVFLARMSVISLGAYEDEMYLDPTSYVLSFEARDEANAEVLLAWREHFVPGDKVVIWAHNAHIGRESAGSGSRCTAGVRAPSSSIGRGPGTPATGSTRRSATTTCPSGWLRSRSTSTGATLPTRRSPATRTRWRCNWTHWARNTCS